MAPVLFIACQLAEVVLQLLNARFLRAVSEAWRCSIPPLPSLSAWNAYFQRLETGVEDGGDVFWYLRTRVNLLQMLKATLPWALDQHLGHLLPRELKLGTRYLEAARAVSPRDPFLIASQGLVQATYIVKVDGWDYTEVEALVDESKATAKECKAWMPSTIHKPELLGVMEQAEKVLEARRKAVPSNYRRRQASAKLSCGDPASIARHAQKMEEKLSKVRQCADCRREGVDMMCCSQCKKACYCNSVCQKNDWKRAHRKECGKVQSESGASSAAGGK